MRLSLGNPTVYPRGYGNCQMLAIPKPAPSKPAMYWKERAQRRCSVQQSQSSCPRLKASKLYKFQFPQSLTAVKGLASGSSTKNLPPFRFGLYRFFDWARRTHLFQMGCDLESES